VEDGKMPAFSLMGPMSPRPYAIGERPGGSDIPSIPLLTGKAAWDSLSGAYDNRHMDSRIRPDVDHTIAPRATDDPRTKKAAFPNLGKLFELLGGARGARALYEPAAAGGVERMLGQGRLALPAPEARLALSGPEARLALPAPGHSYPGMAQWMEGSGVGPSVAMPEVMSPADMARYPWGRDTLRWRSQQYAKPGGLRDLIMANAESTARRKQLALTSDLEQAVRRRALQHRVPWREAARKKVFENQVAAARAGAQQTARQGTQAAAPPPLPEAPGLGPIMRRHWKPIAAVPAMAAGSAAAGAGLGYATQPLAANAGQIASNTAQTAGRALRDTANAAVSAVKPSPSYIEARRAANKPPESGASGGGEGGEAPQAAGFDFSKLLQGHGPMLAGGVAGGLSVYGIHRLLQALRDRRRRRREEFAPSILPKLAAEDPSRFLREYPKVAGFLCACHDADLDDADILDGLVKAAEADGEICAEMEKMGGPLGNMWNKAVNRVGTIGRGISGALTGIGSTIGMGAVAPVAGAQLAAREERAPTGPMGIAQAGIKYFLRPAGEQVEPTPAGRVMKNLADTQRAGFQDVAGSALSLGQQARQDLTTLPWQAPKTPQAPPAVQSLIDTPATEQAWAQHLGQYGVPEWGRQVSRAARGVGETAARMAIFAPAGGPTWAGQATTGAFGNTPIGLSLLHEGPLGAAEKSILDIGASATDSADIARLPEELAALLHKQLSDTYIQGIMNDPSMPEGSKMRATQVAPVVALDKIKEVGRARETQGLVGMEQPAAGQNPNIPGAPQAPPQQAPAQVAQTPPGLDPERVAQLPPEEAQAVQSTVSQAEKKFNDNPEASKDALDQITSDDPNTPVDQQNHLTLMETLGDSETASKVYGQMDDGAKMLLWGGITLGAIGLLSGLASGGLMPLVMTLMGLGTAAGVAGQGGLLGGGIQSLFSQAKQKQAPQPQTPAEPNPIIQQALQDVQAPPPSVDQTPAMQTGAPPGQAQPEPVAATSPADYGAALANIQEGGINPEEAAALMSDVGMRRYLLGLPDDQALAIMQEAAQNPEVAAMLEQAAQPDTKILGMTVGGPADVLATPVGDKFHGHAGYGFTRPNAERFVALARQLSAGQ